MDSQILVVQGNAQIDAWPTISRGEASLAINSTVRTYGEGDPAGRNLGHEYLLNGTPTGATYVNTVGCCFRDGTTDGVHNYATRNAHVYEFNADWSNPQQIIYNFQEAFFGIAYDSTNDSFWVSDHGGDRVMIFNVGRAGNLGNFFYTAHQTGLGPSALALDPADHTLWLYSPLDGFNSPGILEQYSTAPNTEGSAARTPLSSLAFNAPVLAAEFALNSPAAPPGGSIPEPASVMLLASGLIGLWASRRKIS